MIILPNPEEFKFKNCIIAGDECILITPNDITCKWRDDILMFRSIILRKSDHKVVSRSFHKFFNYSEKPDVDPFPDGEFEAIEKRDRSTLIISTHNNETFTRTRGTASSDSLSNGFEVEFLKEKYPKLFLASKLNLDYTILCEWETPTNIIVIRGVTEPTLTLIGVIHNETGDRISQDELDEKGKAWDVARPRRYHFNSHSECIETITTWNDKEGVVLYSKPSGAMRKVKSDWYCKLHKLLSGMKNINTLTEVFITSPKFTTFEGFYDYIEKFKDHEVAEQCKGDISKIVDAYNKILKKIKDVRHVVGMVKSEDGYSRKEQALHITQHYKDWRKTVAFIILDGQEIDDKLLEKLIIENL